MIENIIKELEDRMTKSIEALRTELSRIRSGRANRSLLDHVTVLYYGNETPLNQVANISTEDPRTLSVSPWEKAMIPAIEKAIMSSGLGLNPSTSGSIIRVPLPSLTEERRKEMVKTAKSEAENTRVAVRNVRRDANNQLKALLKDKKISEDDERKAADRTQKLTDKYIAAVDEILAKKEQELMHV